MNDDKREQRKRIDGLLTPQSSVARAFIKTFTNEDKTKRQLNEAGMTDIWSWEAFTFLKIATVALSFAAAFAFGTWREWDFGWIERISFALFFGIATLPGSKLKEKSKLRARAMDRELADVLGLVAACVESGQSLQSAMGYAARENPGAISSYEFSWGIQQTENGLSFPQALQRMAGRIDSIAYRQTLAAMVNGLQKGSQIVDTLKEQATQVRKMRRRKAEEWANKIPVKMMIPLVFCIFPALMIVTIGPAGITIYRGFIEG